MGLRRKEDREAHTLSSDPAGAPIAASAHCPSERRKDPTTAPSPRERARAWRTTALFHRKWLGAFGECVSVCGSIKQAYRARCRWPNARAREERAAVLWEKERKPLKLSLCRVLWVGGWAIATVTARVTAVIIKQRGWGLPEVEDGCAWPQGRQGSGPKPAAIVSSSHVCLFRLARNRACGPPSFSTTHLPT